MTQSNEQQDNISLGTINKLIVDFSKMSPQAERAYARSFVELLKNHHGLELQYRICLKALECIGSYAHQTPPFKPLCLRHDDEDNITVDGKTFKKEELFKTLTKEERRAHETRRKKAVFQHPDFLSWRAECDKVNGSNYSNAVWLERMIATMEEAKDDTNINTVIEIYNTYPAHMENWKKKIYAKCTGKCGS